MGMGQVDICRGNPSGSLLCIPAFILFMCWAGSCLSATLGITRDRNKILRLVGQLNVWVTPHAGHV